MTGQLLPAPVFRAVDANGAPMPGALLRFYLTETTTPASVYTDETLGTALPNPVVADSGGLFAPIYLDPTVIYRCQLLTGGGSLVQDVDPVSAVTEATQAQVNAGSATGVYVSPAKLSDWTGVPAALGYTPLNKAGDTATNLLLTNTSLGSTSAGYLGAPLNEQNASYTFALSDAGKMVRGDNSAAMTYTIPLNASVAFPVGTMIVLRNAGSGVITVTRTSGVTLWIAGSGTSKDVAIAEWGLATLVMENGDEWVISGVGLS